MIYHKTPNMILFLTCISVLGFVQVQATNDCYDETSDGICKCELKGKDTYVTCTGDHVTEVPQNLTRNVTKLYLSGTAIKNLTKRTFAVYPNLVEIFFRDRRALPCLLESIEESAFEGLNSLRILGIVGCVGLKTVKKGAFGYFNSLTTLKIFRSGLVTVPDLSQFKTDTYKNLLSEMDFSGNKIQVIKRKAFATIKTHQLKLEGNSIQTIENKAFSGATIVELLLNDNPQLTVLGEDSFANIKELEKINLSGTSITYLPTNGLSTITELSLFDTKTLRHFPSILTFQKIKKAELSYPHHCCAFKTPEKQNPQAYEEFQRRVQLECSSTSTPAVRSHFTTTMMPTSLRNRGNITDHFRHRRYSDLGWKSLHDPNHSHSGINQSDEKVIENGFGQIVHNFTRTTSSSRNEWIPSTIPSDASNYILVQCGKVVKDYSEVVCTPEPDAFNPCEDVMGYEWLRIFVWLVVMAALFGNAAVLFVLIKSRSKMTVQKFLMCNLAFADLLMGLYLLLLASIDIGTLGEYFNYAILWQNEGGCQAAGFLTVFSCELSIYTLTLITLERWYAISHAIHLTKRLKLRQASGLMAIGWIYAMFVAILPLVGVSDYGNVSICLPMKVENKADAAYIFSILIINGLAFVIICVCYINMYFKVRKSDSTARSSDATIAKRMAMLVFTNFICWAPIAFFGLTASAGLPLIDITHSKILLVFFYPLNSFSNPYLYVIITKQFRKDLFFLLAKYGICTEMANRYKDTVSTKSMTQSRKDSMNLHNVVHPVDGSLSQLTGSFRSSRNSFKNGTPGCTPNGTPTIEKHSIINNITSDNKIDRKLSLVRETTSLDNDGTDHRYQSNRIPDAQIGSSEYVVLYAPLHDSCDKYKPLYKQQTSGSSTATDTTYVSDSGCEDTPIVLNENVPDDSFLVYFETIQEDVFENCPAGAGNQCKEPYKQSSKQYCNDSSDDCDDEDNVQQTLLKHSTLRNSPSSVYDDKLSIRKEPMDHGAFCSFGCDVQYEDK